MVLKMKVKKKILIMLTLSYLSVTFGIFPLLTNNFNQNLDENPVSVINNPINADYWTNFTFIHVNNNWTNFEGYDWLKGNGSWGNPYIIENVTINANDGGFCIRIEHSSAYFIIRNCTLYNADTGNGDLMRLDDVNNGTIFNNTGYDSRYGFMFEDCDNLTIEDNIIHTITHYGIQLDETVNSTIINNTINATRRDIGILDAQEINITGNKMLNSGLYLRGNMLPEVNTHNIDITNTLNGKIVYYYKDENNLNQSNFTNAAQIILANCVYSNITKINITIGAIAIYLFYSSNIIISECNLTNNNEFGAGIYLYSSDNNEIAYNYIRNSRFGIDCNSYSDSNNITHNDIYDTVTAMNIYSYCTNNRILSNEINNTTPGYGIILSSSSSNNVISYNNITNTSNDGIRINNLCYNCNVSNNVVKDGKSIGISIDNGCNNTIVWENQLINNDIGIAIENSTIFESNLNLIYNNTFQLNNLHALDDCSNNDWNNFIIGNYWDNTTDANDDGRPDILIPYNIAGTGNAMDYLPFCDDGDDIGPSITINSPENNYQTENAPIIDVSFYDYYDVNATWYTYIGYPVNYSLAGSGTFQVDAGIWSGLDIGESLTIRIYANDSSGHLSFTDLSIKKTKDDSAKPPSNDFLILMILGIIIGVGGVMGIVIFLKSKKEGRNDIKNS